MRKKILVWAFALSVLCGFQSYLVADVRIVASVDKTEASVGEQFFLTVKVLDGSGNIQAPELPALRDLDIFYTGRASRMSLINGVSSSSLEFTYIVSARRAGTFAIPPLSLSVNGTAFQTNPIQITVHDNGGGYAGQQQAPAQRSAPSGLSQQPVKTSKAQPPAGADNRIFADATLSKLSVYQNEQTLLSYALYTSYDTRYEGFETDAELSGFWIEEFPLEKDVPREMVAIAGRKYIKADIRKLALFPAAPGKYTIKPGQIKTTIKQDQQQNDVFDEFFNDSFFNGGNFFSKRETRLLTPKTIEIEVKPLPEEGKPKGFQGDVGIYQMNATLDRSDVKQNEPVKMTLVIEGSGNVDRVNRPHIPDLKGFRTYEADSKSEISRVNDMISGRKTFEVVFIPRDEGKMFIPPLQFSFFNPLTGKYQTLATPNFPLNVLKGDAEPALPDDVASQPDLKKQVQVEGKDIRYVETDWPRETVLEKTSGWMNPVLILLNILAIAFVGYAIYRRYRERFKTENRGLYRNQRARSGAMSEISQLKKLAHVKTASGQTEFFDCLERAMNAYFADKWDLSAYGTARSEIDRRLREAFGSDDELCQEVADVYQLCDESRFARGEIPESSKDLAVRVFQDVVKRLEKVK